MKFRFDFDHGFLNPGKLTWCVCLLWDYKSLYTIKEHEKSNHFGVFG